MSRHDPDGDEHGAVTVDDLNWHCDGLAYCDCVRNGWADPNCTACHGTGIVNCDEC